MCSPRECRGDIEGAAKDIAFSEDGLHVAVSRGTTVVVYSTKVQAKFTFYQVCSVRTLYHVDIDVIWCVSN